MEWRPIVFVLPPPRSFLCPLCGVVLGAAYGCQQRYSCSHVLCLPCVVQLEEDGVSGCPLDPGSTVAEALSTYNAVNRATRATILNGLQVFCINHRFGCGFIGRLDRLVYHVRHDCRCKVVSCDECGRAMPHSEFRQHLERGCPAGPGHLAARHANDVNGAAKVKASSIGRLGRAWDFRDCHPERRDAASNGLGSGHSNGSPKVASPEEISPRAFVPTRSEGLTYIALLKIPASSWYDRPTTPPSSVPAAHFENAVVGNEAARVTRIPEDEVWIDWPETPESPPVTVCADGGDAVSFRGFRFKVVHLRAELNDPCNERKKFVIFELLVTSPGEDAGNSRWKMVSLALKHPLGEEYLRLQTFNSDHAFQRPRTHDQLAKVAVTTPIEWVTVRDFFVGDRVEVIVSFV